MRLKNKKTKVVDLVNLCRTDKPEFLRLFEGAHKIYEEAFPKHEQESKAQILNYIEESSDSLRVDEGIGGYNYLVPIINGMSGGMHSLDFIPNEKRDFVAHLGPLAIGRNSRGKGFSSLLVNEIFKRTKSYAIQEQLNPLGLVGDVNTFNSPKEVNNYVARLKFHHNHLGFGAVVAIDEKGYAKLMPHGSPGIIKGGQSANTMSFIMAVTPFSDGLEEKISTTPGEIISPSGKILVDKKTIQRIEPETIRDMQQIIFNDYAKLPEVYSPDQISVMLNKSRKALNEVDETYLIPIKDTRYLK